MNNTNKPRTDANEAKKNLRDVFLIVTAMLIAVVVVSVYTPTPATPPPSRESADIVISDFFPGEGSANEGHLPDMSREDLMAQMQREADRSLFAFKINTRSVFNGGASEGNLGIENPNHNSYPFVVKIFLNETGEEVFDSGGMMPNSHISKAALAKALPKGDHAATAYFYAYDPDTMQYSGKAAVDMTLKIIE